MLKVTYKIGELDCKTCVHFLTEKLHKKNIIESFVCDKCNEISFLVDKNTEIDKIQSVIHNIGFETDDILKEEIRSKNFNLNHECK